MFKIFLRSKQEESKEKKSLELLLLQLRMLFFTLIAIYCSRLFLLMYRIFVPQCIKKLEISEKSPEGTSFISLS